MLSDTTLVRKLNLSVTFTLYNLTFSYIHIVKVSLVKSSVFSNTPICYSVKVVSIGPVKVTKPLR